MKYILEFSFECEVIESRKYEGFFVEPQVGERLRIEFENPNYNDYGFWWIVKERQHLLFGKVNGKNSEVQTLTVYIEPDPKDGLPKNDPLYNDYIK